MLLFQPGVCDDRLESTQFSTPRNGPRPAAFRQIHWPAKNPAGIHKLPAPGQTAAASTGIRAVIAQPGQGPIEERSDNSDRRVIEAMGGAIVVKERAKFGANQAEEGRRLPPASGAARQPLPCLVAGPRELSLARPSCPCRVLGNPSIHPPYYLPPDAWALDWLSPCPAAASAE